MKIYTLAETRSHCYGHGDFGQEQLIARMGAYGTGPFPVVYRSALSADRYRNRLTFPQQYVVVELELSDEQT